jgi:hypothetical protein
VTAVSKIKTKVLERIRNRPSSKKYADTMSRRNTVMYNTMETVKETDIHSHSSGETFGRAATLARKSEMEAELGPMEFDNNFFRT